MIYLENIIVKNKKRNFLQNTLRHLAATSAVYWDFNEVFKPESWVMVKYFMKVRDY